MCSVLKIILIASGLYIWWGGPSIFVDIYLQMGGIVVKSVYFHLQKKKKKEPRKTYYYFGELHKILSTNYQLFLYSKNFQGKKEKEQI